MLTADPPPPLPVVPDTALVVAFCSASPSDSFWSRIISCIKAFCSLSSLFWPPKTVLRSSDTARTPLIAVWTNRRPMAIPAIVPATLPKSLASPLLPLPDSPGIFETKFPIAEAALPAMLATLTSPVAKPPIKAKMEPECLPTVVANFATVVEKFSISRWPSFEAVHRLKPWITWLTAGSNLVPMLIARSWTLAFSTSTCILVDSMFF